jgi:hypothetical protein
MSRVSLFFIAFITCFFLVRYQLVGQSTNTASISGVHLTEDGKQVSAIIRIASRTNLTQRPVVATAGKNGTFSFTSLPAGTYQLCSTVTNDKYVDSCLWSTNPPTVTVAEGQAVTGVNLTVKKASTLKVHVNDPGKLIKDTPQGAILMGVMGAHQRFYPALRNNSNSNGNDYEVLVPFDTPFAFSIVPVGLALVDVNNAPVGDRQKLTLTHSSTGPTPPVLTYTVAGKR